LSEILAFSSFLPPFAVRMISSRTSPMVRRTVAPSALTSPMAGSASMSSSLPVAGFSARARAIIAIDAVFPVPPLPHTPTSLLLGLDDSDMGSTPLLVVRR
jgi:hypothetical protein